MVPRYMGNNIKHIPLTPLCLGVFDRVFRGRLKESEDIIHLIPQLVQLSDHKKGNLNSNIHARKILDIMANIDSQSLDVNIFHDINRRLNDYGDLLKHLRILKSKDCIEQNYLTPNSFQALSLLPNFDEIIKILENADFTKPFIINSNAFLLLCQNPGLGYRFIALRAVKPVFHELPYSPELFEKLLQHHKSLEQYYTIMSLLHSSNLLSINLLEKLDIFKTKIDSLHTIVRSLYGSLLNRQNLNSLIEQPHKITVFANVLATSALIKDIKQDDFDQLCQAKYIKGNHQHCINFSVNYLTQQLDLTKYNNMLTSHQLDFPRISSIIALLYDFKLIDFDDNDPDPFPLLANVNEANLALLTNIFKILINNQRIDRAIISKLLTIESSEELTTLWYGVLNIKYDFADTFSIEDMPFVLSQGKYLYSIQTSLQTLKNRSILTPEIKALVFANPEATSTSNTIIQGSPLKGESLLTLVKLTYNYHSDIGTGLKTCWVQFSRWSPGLAKPDNFKLFLCFSAFIEKNNKILQNIFTRQLEQSTFEKIINNLHRAALINQVIDGAQLGKESGDFAPTLSHSELNTLLDLAIGAEITSKKDIDAVVLKAFVMMDSGTEQKMKQSFSSP